MYMDNDINGPRHGKYLIFEMSHLYITKSMRINAECKNDFFFFFFLISSVKMNYDIKPHLFKLLLSCMET